MKNNVCISQDIVKFNEDMIMGSKSIILTTICPFWGSSYIYLESRAVGLFFQVSGSSIWIPCRQWWKAGVLERGQGSLAASERMAHLLWYPRWFKHLFLVWQEQALIRSVEFKFKFRNLLLFLLFYEVTCVCLRTFALLGLCRLQKAGRDCMDWLLQGTLSRCNLAT